MYIQEQVSFVPCGIHLSPMLGIHYRDITYLFPDIPNGNHTLEVAYEEACVPKPSINDLQHSRALLPNKT